MMHDALLSCSLIFILFTSVHAVVMVPSFISVSFMCSEMHFVQYNKYVKRIVFSKAFLEN